MREELTKGISNYLKNFMNAIVLAKLRFNVVYVLL